MNGKPIGPDKKIIVALDVSDTKTALDNIDLLKDYIEVFKVGLELYTVAGPSIIQEIHKRNKKVFLDLKFHDIPNTVSRAALAAVRQGVFMFTVHASGGSEMMKKCSGDVVSFCLRENLARPRILAVTVLTSIPGEVLRDELGIPYSLNTHVKHLAGMAQKAGVDGVVASGSEAKMLRDRYGRGFLIITPGIRPSWTPADDQMRTVTPKQAVRAGADYLVMGRAILNQSDPIGAIQRIGNEIAEI